jgi:hypothetical protein
MLKENREIFDRIENGVKIALGLVKAEPDAIAVNETAGVDEEE